MPPWSSAQNWVRLALSATRMRAPTSDTWPFLLFLVRSELPVWIVTCLYALVLASNRWKVTPTSPLAMVMTDVSLPGSFWVRPSRHDMK